MRCIHCGSPDIEVVDSRETEGENARRRRYHCNVCQHRFTTMEVSVGGRLRYGEFKKNAQAFNSAGPADTMARLSIKQLCDEIVRRTAGGDDDLGTV